MRAIALGVRGTIVARQRCCSDRVCAGPQRRCVGEEKLFRPLPSVEVLRLRHGPCCHCLQQYGDGRVSELGLREAADQSKASRTTMNRSRGGQDAFIVTPPPETKIITPPLTADASEAASVALELGSCPAAHRQPATVHHRRDHASVGPYTPAQACGDTATFSDVCPVGRRCTMRCLRA